MKLKKLTIAVPNDLLERAIALSGQGIRPFILTRDNDFRVFKRVAGLRML